MLARRGIDEMGSCCIYLKASFSSLFDKVCLNTLGGAGTDISSIRKSSALSESHEDNLRAFITISRDFLVMSTNF